MCHTRLFGNFAYESVNPLFFLFTCFSNSSLSYFLFQHNFPRTLEALILHLLSPVAAEVLTRKFDELDRLISEDDRYFI